jgi:hypothetical protein
MPDVFDIFLSDVDDKTLNNEISKAVGVDYLSEVQHTQPSPTVNGIIFGKYKRVIFPLVVGRFRKPSSYVVHFLFDSGSPHTYLSKEVWSP